MVSGAESEVVAAVPSRGPGRPPDLEKRQHVLDATREILAEVGYGGLTVGAVADRAGSNRVLIYRVWETKAGLVSDALFGTADDLIVPDTGSLRGDLRDFVAQLVDHMSLPAYVKGVPGLTVEMLADPVLSRTAWDRYVRPAEDGFGAILSRGRERGEVGGSSDPRLLTRVVSGTVTGLAQTTRLSPAEITDVIVAMFVGGLIQPADEASPIM